MNARWRLFVAALRLDFPSAETQRDALRFVPLSGLLLGVAAATVYWLAAQLWPTSIAVVLAMLTSSAIGAPTVGGSGAGRGANPPYPLFYLLLKFSTLMALSSAKLPFVVPEHLILGIIMTAGIGASRALVVSLVATDPATADRPTTGELVLALAVGAAPGVLLGIPGLIGLAAALAMRLGQSAIRPVRPIARAARLEFTQQLSEICFYLAALAAWRYI